MAQFRNITVAALAAALLTSCASTPTDYTSTLSQADSKWNAPACAKARADAANYDATGKKPLSWGAGLALGPYGLGIAAASHDHYRKKRREFAREVHLQCSSHPLPASLQESAG